MPYPQFRAGQRVTAALLNAGKPEITQTAGTQTNATTTMADVLGMGFWALKNKRYLCQVLIAFDAPTATDARFAWWANSGTMQRNIISQALGSTTNIDTNAVLLRRDALTPQPVGGTAGVTNAFSLYQETSVLNTSGTDGWCTVQFCANAAGTVTIQDGSTLIYTELP